MEPPAGGHLAGGRRAQSHAADDVLLDVLHKCSSTGAVAKLSTAYLEEAKCNHTTCDAHLVPRAVLGTPSTRCSTSSARRSPTSHEQEPPRHLGLRKLNETAARASRARAHMREELLTELHIPSWPCGQEGADGRHRPRLEVEGGPSSRRSRRGRGHQGQRGGSRRIARRSCVSPRPSPRCVEAAVKALSIVCEEGKHHQDDEHRRRRRCMWSTTPSSATSDALVSSNTDIM